MRTSECESSWFQAIDAVISDALVPTLTGLGIPDMSKLHLKPQGFDHSKLLCSALEVDSVVNDSIILHAQIMLAKYIYYSDVHKYPINNLNGQFYRFTAMIYLASVGGY
ncbi:hypothetical protein GJ496_006781 [Pomphorhynchus laevis]|nr:hypothetical protein GJ496_006781 [Pomphorhynchus laevis]